MRVLALLALLALLACRDAVVPVPVQPSTLTVTVGAVPLARWEWPWDSGDTVMVNNSLEDEAGLAGLEVEITDVADGLVRTHRFDASDLEEGVTPYDVPESGTAHAQVRLTRHGKVVAMGVAEWALQPEIEWKVEIQRTPYPPAVGISPTEDLSKAQYRCSWGWCQNVWRFDISEDALNYPGDTFWLLLWAVRECPSGLVCF